MTFSYLALAFYFVARDNTSLALLAFDGHVTQSKAERAIARSTLEASCSQRLGNVQSGL